MFKPIVAVVGAMASETLSAPMGFAYAATGLFMLLCYGLKQVLGTTFRAPCLWALASVACLAWASWVTSTAKLNPGIGLSSLRFAAAASTLCPLMAILGAKRPQNRGWQWVVLTLWIVAIWPTAQAVLVPTGVHVELFVVWKLFLLGLVVVGLMNYLPTRNWFAAWLVASGQLVLLDAYLWSWGSLSPSWVDTIGLGCFLAAAMVVGVRFLKKEKKGDDKGPPSLALFDQQWLDFRDAFGTLWALRIMARVNQTAEVRDWPMRLEWPGFVSTESSVSKQPTAEQLSELELAMSTLLRRFV